MKNQIRDILYSDQKTNVNLKKILEMTFLNSYPIKIEKNIGEEYFNDVIPFYYGEYPTFINPADNMGWDVIVISNDKNFDNLTCQGIVPIDENANLIPKPYGNKPGNHKLILSKQPLSLEEKDMINAFFKEKKAFSQPVYFDEKHVESFLQENWEKETLGKYKLGHFVDTETTGIAVGPTARKYYGADKMK